MSNLRKLIYTCMLVCCFSFNSVKAADCGKVTLTEMDWASAQVVTAVAKFLIEKGYGCSITKVPSASIPALASVAETGEPDILTEIWTNAAPAYDGLVESGKIKPLTEVLSDGGIEGFYIPNYLAEAHPELKTLEGILANPKLVGGRFHNCPVGWTCKNVGTNIAKAAGFEKAGIEDFIHGSGETLAASIGEAYSAKKPWFGFYWGPTAILGKYPMTLVEMAPANAEAHKCNSKEDCATPKVAAFPKSIVTTVVSSEFEKSNPEVTTLMKNLSFTNDMMGKLLSWKKDKKATGEETAAHFISNHSDIWSKWINDDARKNLAALIK